jgi:hypothetical protein
VGVFAGRINCSIDCIAYYQFPGNKSSNCESRKEFENRIECDKCANVEIKKIADFGKSGF